MRLVAIIVPNSSWSISCSARVESEADGFVALPIPWHVGNELVVPGPFDQISQPFHRPFRFLARGHCEQEEGKSMGPRPLPKR